MSVLKRILVCEDDDGIAEVFKIILEDEGYEVIVQKRGRAVIDFLKKDTADLLLLDVLMPGMSGKEVAKLIRRDKRNKHLPIVLVSATSELEKTAEEIGADDYISKPFKMDNLLKIVKKYSPI